MTALATRQVEAWELQLNLEAQAGLRARGALHGRTDYVTWDPENGMCEHVVGLRIGVPGGRPGGSYGQLAPEDAALRAIRLDLGFRHEHGDGMVVYTRSPMQLRRDGTGRYESVGEPWEMVVDTHVAFEGEAYRCTSRSGLPADRTEEFVARDMPGLGDWSLWIIDGERVALDDAE